MEHKTSHFKKIGVLKDVRSFPDKQALSVKKLPHWPQHGQAINLL